MSTLDKLRPHSFLWPDCWLWKLELLELDLPLLQSEPSSPPFSAIDTDLSESVGDADEVQNKGLSLLFKNSSIATGSSSRLLDTALTLRDRRLGTLLPGSSDWYCLAEEEVPGFAKLPLLEVDLKAETAIFSRRANR